MTSDFGSQKEMPDQGRSRLPRMSDQQRSLYAALSANHDESAEMYAACLSLLATEDALDALPLAAHEMRELMDMLPLSLDAPVAVHHERLGDAVQRLQERWISTVSNLECFDGCSWSGVIESELGDLLNEFKEFFTWHGSLHPRRRDETATLMQRVDPRGIDLPPVLVDWRVRAWEGLRDFFNEVAHHSRPRPTRSVFSTRLSELESMLLDLLLPRTAEDLRNIQGLIDEG